MNESAFTKEICDKIKKCNGMIYPLIGQKIETKAGKIYAGQVAWPDRLIVHKYWQGLIEFKGLKTKLRDEQRIIIRRLKERGMSVYVVRYPGVVQDEEGNELCVIMDGLDLLKKLRDLENV